MASIEVKWKKMGVEFTYDIWYATKLDGPWIKYNTELLTDEVIDKKSRVLDPAFIYTTENTYIIDGLKDNTKYHVKVTCDDRYYQWWYSYSAYDSIDGGYGSSINRPVAQEGNYRGFQVEV